MKTAAFLLSGLVALACAGPSDQGPTTDGVVADYVIPTDVIAEIEPDTSADSSFEEECIDADNDGFGKRLAMGVLPAACSNPKPDCDDNDPNVHPGATEICNGVDDDCNGHTDEEGVCGPDPCIGYEDGDACGEMRVCWQGICCDRAPACDVRECGPDGCGGECGTCAPGEYCQPDYNCHPKVCVPDCDVHECGSDGCGGICGTCVEGESCWPDHTCQPGVCTPTCDGKHCGSDGCWGTCECSHGSTCSGTTCQACDQACEPGAPHCDASTSVRCVEDVSGCTSVNYEYCDWGCSNGNCGASPIVSCSLDGGSCSNIGAYKCSGACSYVCLCADDYCEITRWELSKNCSNGGVGCMCTIFSGMGACAVDGEWNQMCY